MPEFITTGIENDPTAIANGVFDYIENFLPGYEPAPGNIDTLIIESFAQEAADTADVAGSVATDVFRFFGVLVGIPQVDAIPATGEAVFEAVDTTGYTVPAGSTIGFLDTNAEIQAFSTIIDTAITPGNTTATVAIRAIQAGAIGNNLSGTAELISVPGWVIGATISGGTPTSGGTDREDDLTYLGRLSETLTLLTPRPILPADFSILARSVAGVYRATTIDGLKPGPPYDGSAESTANERMVTVAVTASDGSDPGATIRANALAYLDGLREATFQVWVVAATYTQIKVTTTVKKYPGFDSADVQSNVVAALADYLNPATWGAGPGPDPTFWVDDPTVRLGGLYHAIDNVSGVQYVSALTFAKQADALAATDVDLSPSSAIPGLPTSGTFVVTVT